MELAQLTQQRIAVMQEQNSVMEQLLKLCTEELQHRLMAFNISPSKDDVRLLSRCIKRGDKLCAEFAEITFPEMTMEQRLAGMDITMKFANVKSSVICAIDEFGATV